MALPKVNYTDHQTVITAANLNNIQNEIISTSEYTTCATAANTAAKTATLADFVLATGSSVKVKFTYSNTAASPTLNINSTGAKAIKMYGNTAVGTTPLTSWEEGAVVSFVYDGTNWIVVGWNEDGGTMYVSTEYTSLLDMFNDLKSTVKFPISVFKGNTTTAYTDLPNGMNSTGEFTVMFVGYPTKANAVICGYYQPASVWIRSIYNGAWNGAWKQSGSTYRDSVTINTYNADTTEGKSTLYLGNGTANGTVGNSTGEIKMYGNGTYFTTLNAPNSTGWRTATLPDASGTIMLDAGGTFSGNVRVNVENGTASTLGTSAFTIGNGTPAGTAGNSKGQLLIYGDGAYRGNIQASNVTSHRTYELPNASGTLIVKEDYKTGTITPVSGATISEGLAIQWGRAVHIKGYATFSSAITANTETQIASITGVDAPTSITRTQCVTDSAYAWQAVNNAYFVCSGGKIYVRTPNSGQKIVVFCLSYLV